jgi:thiol:disulfide interchange protein DsbC
MRLPVAVALSCLAGLPASSFAQSAAAPAKATDPRVEIAKKIPGAKPDDVRKTPLPGIYELRRGGDIAYVSTDADYALMGDLYDLSNNDNLTEARRRELRVAMLDSVPDSQMLIFPAKNPKYVIDVFTDVDCGYCRKLHGQIAEYNRLGVTVRYFLYPRSGPDTDSWRKAESVWCSRDRNDALTRAKRGETVKAGPCGVTPIARHFELGQDLSIEGTPAIFLATGEVLPGYVPPAMLVDHLKTSAKPVAAR